MAAWPLLVSVAPRLEGGDAVMSLRYDWPPKRGTSVRLFALLNAFCHDICDAIIPSLSHSSAIYIVVGSS